MDAICVLAPLAANFKTISVPFMSAAAKVIL